MLDQRPAVAKRLLSRAVAGWGSGIYGLASRGEGFSSGFSWGLGQHLLRLFSRQSLNMSLHFVAVSVYIYICMFTDVIFYDSS